MTSESANAQDARVKELWHALDYDGKSQLDIVDLKHGLRKIDHPLKTAGPLLEDILKKIDANKDGRISYAEFRMFVTHTEHQLRLLFDSIDRNHDGTLDKAELQAAFRGAGLVVSNRKLDNFFARVDENGDGAVSFEEWRDFLLFLPSASANLETVLEYYSTSARLSPDGDILISDESFESIGTIKRFLTSLFGSLIVVAHPPLPASPSLFPEVPQSNTNEELVTVAEPKVLHSVNPTQLDKYRVVLIACAPSPGYFVAGGLAGITSRSATAPLDRLKTFLIAQTTCSNDGVMALKSLNPIKAVNHFWSTTSGAVNQLWAAGGMRSLYAGNGINIVKVMPETSIRFGVFEFTKRMCAHLEGHNNPKKISTLSKLFAGGIGGMAAQFVVYPLDTLKFRMQCETVSGGLHGNKLLLATARKLWAAGGVRAYYRGLPAGLIGMFPYSAIDLATFEHLKSRITNRNVRKYGCHEEDGAPNSAATAVIGGFSGAVGASLVYPLNLLRTRLQSQGTVLHQRTYTGLWDAAAQTVKGEGVGGLFKGLTPNLVKVVPSVAITYVVYENAKKHWGLD